MKKIGNLIFILLFILFIKNILKSKTNGVIAYIVFSLISPHFSIGGYQLSYEIIAFFPLIVFFLLKRKNIFTIYIKDTAKQYLWIYLFIFIIASLLSSSKYVSNISIFPIFGHFRFICVIYMLQDIMQEKSGKVLDYILSSVLVINCIVSFIQLTVPASTTLFYNLYFKESLTPLKEVAELGYFNRAYGTFGTPVVLGIFSAFSFAVYLGFISEKQNYKYLYLKLIFSVILGLTALSKTVILSIPIILIFYYLFIVFGLIKVKNKKVLLIPLIVIPVFIFMVNYLEKAGTSITYYLQYLTNPFDALITRYDSSSGILVGSMEIIKENLFLGVGSTLIPNVFNGDSMYTGILFNTGIVGFCIYFLPLIKATIKNLIKNNTSSLLCVIAICLAGLAAPIQFDLLTSPLLAYVFSKSENYI